MYHGGPGSSVGEHSSACSLAPLASCFLRRLVLSVVFRTPCLLLNQCFHCFPCAHVSCAVDGCLHCTSHPCPVSRVIVRPPAGGFPHPPTHPAVQRCHFAEDPLRSPPSACCLLSAHPCSPWPPWSRGSDTLSRFFLSLCSLFSVSFPALSFPSS